MNGYLPQLSVEARCLPDAWEQSLLALWKNHAEVKTAYDREGDPPSWDAGMTLTITDPLSEPMIHRDMPGGLEDLQEYVMEVCEGIKDHWVRDPRNPQDTRWEYTYHQRLTAYRVSPEAAPIDQLEHMAQALAREPHTRRAQAITWQPNLDLFAYDPPCLQSISGRLLPDDYQPSLWRLNWHVRFRSNDAYEAALMNMFALIQLQQRMAQRIQELRQEPVVLGPYVHQADSYHIYGRVIDKFRQRFLTAYAQRPFERRTYRYSGEIHRLMQAAIPGIREKIARHDA
jgi:thymidylate synthase